MSLAADGVPWLWRSGVHLDVLLTQLGKEVCRLVDPAPLEIVGRAGDAPGVDRVTTDTVDYIHLMCARHEVILSNGAWTESFQPGDYAVSGMERRQQAEIYALFPELADTSDGFREARRGLKRHEAKLILN